MGYGEELYGKRVGVVAASLTGRAFIRLLQPFGCDVLVYDPYLSPERAAALGVRLVDDLGELMATCDVVSNHAPTTPETDGLISAGALARLRDGALFVNTARAAAIDYTALMAELQRGASGPPSTSSPRAPGRRQPPAGPPQRGAQPARGRGHGRVPAPPGVGHDRRDGPLLRRASPCATG